MNRSDEASSREFQWVEFYIANPPMKATAPWEPRHTDYSGAGTTLVGYGYSSDPENMPYSVLRDSVLVMMFQQGHRPLL